VTEEPPKAECGYNKKQSTGKNLNTSPNTDNGDYGDKKVPNTDIGIGKTYQNTGRETKTVKDQTVKKKNSSSIRTDTGKVEVHSSAASTLTSAAEHNKSQAEQSKFLGCTQKIWYQQTQN